MATPCFRVGEIPNGQDYYPEVLKAEYLGRHASWRRFRIPGTGQEWKENGMRWYFTREEALRAYIHSKYPSQERKLIEAWFGGPGEEQHFRLLVEACVLLAQEWRRQSTTLSDATV
jgi:hypothetical protein